MKEIFEKGTRSISFESSFGKGHVLQEEAQQIRAIKQQTKEWDINEPMHQFIEFVAEHGDRLSMSGEIVIFDRSVDRVRSRKTL